MGRDGLDAFPSVAVFDDGSELLLVDGFHRFMAAKSLGHETIRCRVYSGSKLEAGWFACGCNRSHGLRRTTADKQRAVDCALRCDSTKSDSEIARHVGVCGKTVGNYRRSLRVTSEIPESALRVGADGRSVNTTNIGKRTTKLTSTVDEKRSEVESTPPLRPTTESSEQASRAPRSAQLSPQSAADCPLQTDSWDQLRDWLQRRIRAQGHEAVWSELRCVLETLDFPIETIETIDSETSKVSIDKTPSEKTADAEPPASVLFQDWVSVEV